MADIWRIYYLPARPFRIRASLFFSPRKTHGVGEAGNTLFFLFHTVTKTLLIFLVQAVNVDGQFIKGLRAEYF